MSIWVGIEGGGTSTRILWQRDDLSPQYFEQPTSFKVRNGNVAASARTLLALLQRAIPDGLEEITSIAIGLSGISRPDDQDLLRDAILRQPELSAVTLQIQTDATLTLSAVLPEGAEGILLIAGTGSVVFFQPSGERPRRIGGWGPLLSDEGSGYRIGLRALNYYVRVLDGVYPADLLSEAITERLPNEFQADRVELSRLAENDHAFVASLVPHIFEASKSSEAAHDMVYEELIELVTLIFPVFQPNVMNGAKPYKLFLSGSIAKHPIMLDILANAFEATDLSPIPVDDRVPCMKALEIARGL